MQSWNHPFENFMDATTSWLTIMRYLFRQMTTDKFHRRNQIAVISAVNVTNRIRLGTELGNTWATRRVKESRGVVVSASDY